MKKIIHLFCICMVLFSCKKAKELLDITVSFSMKNDFVLSKTGDIEQAIAEQLVTVKSPEITNTLPQEFKDRNADINNIKSVALESVVLTITTPPTQNFSFMKSITIYLGATGKPEIKIASQDNINAMPPSQTLNLTVANADIAPYLKGATYYIKSEVIVVKNYTSDINITSEIKGKAVANPLNK